MLSIDRLSLDYQARYCEENVWRLLARSELEVRRSSAVIVSSIDVSSNSPGDLYDLAKMSAFAS